MLEPTDAALDWLQENCRIGWRRRDPGVLAAEFNRAFARDVAGAWIADVIERHGRAPRVDSAKPLLTWAQDRFLRAEYREHSVRECAAPLNERYGTALTVAQIKEYIGGRNRARSARASTRNPIPSGRSGRFEKGDTPANTMRPGQEVVRRYGARGGKKRPPEIHVVLDEPNPWTGSKHYIKRKALVAWEAEHGPIPKGTCIIHADGDTMNCDLDNLVALTRQELAIFNREFAPGELVGDRQGRMAAILAAKLKARAHQREREIKETT